MPFLQTRPDGSLLLRLRVQPRAGSNGFAGLHGDALKLRLTTPPVDGKANRAVIAFLAKRLHVAKSCVEIRSGHQGRNKEILLHDIDEKTARRLLTAGR